MRFSRWLRRSYRQPLQLNNQNRVRLRLEALEERTLLSAAVQGDAVIRWNNVALNAQVVDMTPLAGVPGAGLGVNPGPVYAVRALAIEQAAVYDAVNSIDGSYTPYLVTSAAPAGASIDAAAAQAAHDTLVALYPAQHASFDVALAQDLAAIPDGIAKTEGVQTGAHAAAVILAARANDGSALKAPYSQPSNPGVWQVDPLHPTQTPYGVDAGNIAPFAISNPNDYQAPPPPAPGTPEFAAGLQQVMTLGGDGINTPTTRTPAQTLEGLFWSYDGSPGMGVPPRFYNEITQQIALQENNTEVQNARLFFLVDVALADAGIVSWNTKYTYDYWRPIQAARSTGLGGGNDPTWMPLGATYDNPQLTNAKMPSNFTPPFPAYSSGHATFGAALFQTLADFYGTDNVTFTVTSDELNGKTIGLDASGLPYVRPLAPMTFTSFSQAAYSNAQSRIYLGIHWTWDRDAGLTQGDAVGNAVFGKLAAPRMNGSDLYANAIYEALLNRRADSSGIGFFNSMTGQGISDAQMPVMMTSSPEYQTNTVQQAFQKYLHRTADSSGLTYFTNMLNQGGTLEQVDAAILGSAEYTASQGDAAWLNSVYTNVLGHGADAGGLSYWTGQMSQGASHAAVAYQILMSTEAAQNVTASYFQQYLGRAASAADLGFYAHVLQQGGGQESILTAILGSTEYQQRVTRS